MVCKFTIVLPNPHIFQIYLGFFPLLVYTCFKGRIVTRDSIWPWNLWFLFITIRLHLHKNKCWTKNVRSPVSKVPIPLSKVEDFIHLLSLNLLQNGIASKPVSVLLSILYKTNIKTRLSVWKCRIFDKNFLKIEQEKSLAWETTSYLHLTSEEWERKFVGLESSNEAVIKEYENDLFTTWHISMMVNNCRNPWQQLIKGVQ